MDQRQDLPPPHARPRRRFLRARTLPPAADIPLPPPERDDDVWPRWIVAGLVAVGLTILVLIALIASPGTFGLASESRLERAEERLEVLAQRVQSLEAGRAPAEAPASALEPRIAGVESSLAGAVRDLASLRAAVSRLCGANPAVGC